MMSEVHISSVVVHARPDQAETVARRIGDLGAEVVPTVGGLAAGRLVVVVERGSDRDVVEVLDQVNAIPGVLSALLVYHHAEPAADLEDMVS